MIRNKIIVIVFAMLILAVGVFCVVYVNYNSKTAEPDEIEIELRFLEERQQDLAMLYDNSSQLYIDFDPDDHAVWGIIKDYSKAEQQLFDISNLKNFNFDTEYVVYCTNRKIKSMSYPKKGIHESFSPSSTFYYAKVVLSQEYFPNTVFYYAIEQIDCDVRPGVYYPRVYDEYTQIEQ